MLENILEQVDRVVEPKDIVGFAIKNEPTTIFDSKIGGIPYFPKDMEYPTCNGTPMNLLAQLNFDKIPHLNGYPTTGILQFYIARDEVYGADFDDMITQKGYRIIYHKDIITDTSKLIEVQQDYNDDILPFRQPYLLVPHEVEKMYASDYDEDFNQVFVEYYNDTVIDEDEMIDSVYDLSDQVIEDEIRGRNNRYYAWIGGNPIFAQSDPRYLNKYKSYKLLLFELDSIMSKDVYIMWGDSGTGEFFISEENLKNLNFSNTMYNWDCC